jgi:hypothetical protein
MLRYGIRLQWADHAALIQYTRKAVEGGYNPKTHNFQRRRAMDETVINLSKKKCISMMSPLYQGVHI